eukprot:TRINITY_DN8883_c0_g2_i2.p1 TRINITY_DN8883_c0_g2~~TRINITY_DN8883_c0_g2_i2.p1  ORF type:complete len:201 (+),score=32.76 TRINITY_DN8883_c0_g2_i2:180-782(+)
MLGLLVPGRLPDVEPEQVDVNKLMFPLAAPEAVNHLSVFMTGQAPFEDGVAAGIYLCWPNPEPSWHYLGFVSNDKPSALFRIAKVRPQSTVDVNPFDGMPVMQNASTDMAQIGVSIEPLADLMQQTEANHAKATSASDFAGFANYAVESLINFVGSFTVTQDEAMFRAAQGEDGWVPIGCVNKWLESINAKLQHDPTFWR